MRRWRRVGGDTRAGMGGGVEQSIGLVKVSVTDVRVEHEVKLGIFTKWWRGRVGSPRDVIQRGRVREILGMGR